MTEEDAVEFAALCGVVVFEDVDHGESPFVVLDDGCGVWCSDYGYDVVSQSAVLFPEGVYVCFGRLEDVLPFFCIDGLCGRCVCECRACLYLDEEDGGVVLVDADDVEFGVLVSPVAVSDVPSFLFEESGCDVFAPFPEFVVLCHIQRVGGSISTPTQWVLIIPTQSISLKTRPNALYLFSIL